MTRYIYNTEAKTIYCDNEKKAVEKAKSLLDAGFLFLNIQKTQKKIKIEINRQSQICETEFTMVNSVKKLLTEEFVELKIGMEKNDSN